MDTEMQVLLGKAHAEIQRQVGADPDLVVSDLDEGGRVQVEGTLDLGAIIMAVQTAGRPDAFLHAQITAHLPAGRPAHASCAASFPNDVRAFLDEMLRGRWSLLNWSVAVWPGK